MIWCVEDDPSIREIEVYALNSTGLEARGFADGGEFREALETERPELVLLDVMLPGEDGVTILKRLRADERYRDIPVIMATAKGTEFDKVQSLDLGADDYITKPFLMQELLLRVSGILRRVYRGQLQRETVLRLGDCTVDFGDATVTTSSGTISLTATERTILQKLLDNRGRIVTYDALCEAVWGGDYYGYENSLNVHIRHLREKVEEQPSQPRWILTARGLGYRLAKEESQ